METIGILGAGSWGTALARVLSLRGHEVRVWSPHDVTELRQERRNKHLPGMVIPEEILFTQDMGEALRGAGTALMAVPSPYVRATVGLAAPHLEDGAVVVSAAKGIEPDTLLTMTEIMESVLREARPGQCFPMTALSGPSHAEEVALDLPTAVVSASRDLSAAEKVVSLFDGTCLRVYTNDDILGVELCGALKNIIALAAGICDGLGYGDNTKAALVTRGMAEIRRLGVSLGCREETFAGLAGIGDLFVTATSRHSRNNRCGYLIGQGHSPRRAAAEIGMVVEGINALPAAQTLSHRQGVEMPITRAVYRVVFQDYSPRQAVTELMRRDTRSELEMHM